MKNKVFRTLVCLISCLFTTQAMSVDVGSKKAETVVTGGAGGANSQGANAALEHCGTSLGTVAIDEDEYAGWYSRMGQYGIQSTVPILRVLAQQSNCFIVVERSHRGLKHIERERALMDSGELRQTSNFGKGQLVAADYTIIPSLVFKDNDAGGVGAAIGGLFGSVGALLGGSLKFADAQSVMTLVENRSGVQVAAAEGSARGTSLAGGLGAIGGGFGGALAGYTNTAEGKVIVGAMMDAFNTLVKSTKNYRAQTVGSPGGLGSGGALKIDGAPQPSAPAATAAAGAAGGSLKDRIRRAQETLNALGYDAGVPDGKVGGKTKTAITHFQQDMGLNVTGRLDPTTLQTILSQ